MDAARADHSVDVPRLPPAYLERPRLIDDLDRAEEADLTVLSGPAGSGKTTLLAAWVSRPRSAALTWVSPPEEDVDPAWLWRRLYGALVTTEFPARLTYQRLADALHERGRPVLVVIDDAHRLAPSTTERLARLGGSPHTRILLASRHGPRASTPLTHQFHVAHLDGDRMAFTPAETRALATATTGSDASAAQVYAATGGHPLLTRMLLAAPGGRHRLTVIAEVGDWARSLVSPDNLAAAELLAGIPVLTPRVTTLVSGRPDPADLLDGFADDGLGTYDTEGAFRFHETIGAVLEHAGNADLGAERMEGARAQALSAYRQDPGHAMPAFRLLARSGQTNELWPHMAEHYFALLSEADSVLDVLDTLPVETVARDGTLGAVRAVAQRSLGALSSLSLRDTATIALDEIGQRPPASTAVETFYRSLATLVLLRSTQQFDEATAAAETWLANTMQLKAHLRVAMSPAITTGLLHAAAAFTTSARMDRALAALAQMDTRVQQHADRCLQIQRAFISAMRGDVDDARVGAAATTHLPPFLSAWIGRDAITRAAILVEDGDCTGSRELLDALEPALDQLDEWPYALIVLARSYVPGDVAAGVEHVDRLLDRHRSRPIASGTRDLLDSAVGDLALLAGDASRARALCSRRRESDTALHLTAARLALITNDPEAPEQLMQLLRRPDLWPRLRAQALLLLAVHLNRASHTDAAHTALRRSLSITQSCGIGLIHALLPTGELRSLAHGAGLELPSNAPAPSPLADPLSAIRLTPREWALLRQLATPALLREIAAADFVSINTIRSQAASLYRKLGAKSRRQAVATGYRRGLLPGGPRSDQLPRETDRSGSRQPSPLGGSAPAPPAIEERHRVARPATLARSPSQSDVAPASTARRR